MWFGWRGEPGNRSHWFLLVSGFGTWTEAIGTLFEFHRRGIGGRLGNLWEEWGYGRFWMGVDWNLEGFVLRVGVFLYDCCCCGGCFSLGLK